MKISPITTSDENFLEVGQDMAEEMLGHYKKDWNGEPFTPAMMEEVFGMWLDNPSYFEPDVVANSLGTAFGNYMVQNLGMKWALVTDEYGTAMAVCHENPSWTVFPFDAVRKRIESKERRFFQAIYEMTAEKRVT